MSQGDDVLLFRNAPLQVAVDIMQEAAAWLEQRGEPLWDPRELTEASLSQRCQVHEVFVGELSGEPVVTALIQDRDPAVWPDDGKALVIHKLAVRRKYAGRGFARRMLEFAGQHASSLGKKKLRLDTVATRMKLRRFYEDAGFTYVGQKTLGRYQLALFEKSL